MTLETKFDVGDTIWFMYNNRPMCAVVTTMIVTKNESVYGEEYQCPTRDRRHDIHHTFAFKTKEDLLASL